MTTKRKYNVVQLTDTPKIEKGITMPPRRGSSDHWKFALSMGVGDSFFLSFKQYSKNASGSFRAWAKAYDKWEFSCRTYDDGVRIWRMK